VANAEAGRGPGGAAAVRQLVARLCGGPWATAEERSQAQALVARLERLRWAAARAARPAPAPLDGQAGPAPFDAPAL
jgi:hypothetical protein